MTRRAGGQHLVFDAEVVDGLVYAYRAREALQLPDSDRDEDPRRDPQHRARLLLALPDDPPEPGQLVRADVRRRRDRDRRPRRCSSATCPLQLKRFFNGVRAAARPASATSAPACASTTSRARTINGTTNVDSAEYANIVLTFTRFYDQARRAGMAAADRLRPARSRASGSSASISGYWTHAGYMNWDSGLGFERWHQGKKLGLTQEALIGLASVATRCCPGKHVGPVVEVDARQRLRLLRAARRALARTASPDPVLFDVNAVPQGAGSAYLAAARIQANAARAIDAGLGKKAAPTPPPLYSLRPRHRPPRRDHARPTTPRSSPSTSRRSRTAASTSRGCSTASRKSRRTSAAARRPPSACSCATSAGRRVTASQVGRSRVEPGVAPAAADQGAERRGRDLVAPRSAAPTPGPFSDLRATGAMSARGAVAARHAPLHARLDPDATGPSTRRTGNARYTADVLFPSWAGDGTSPRRSSRCCATARG